MQSAAEPLLNPEDYVIVNIPTFQARFTASIEKLLQIATPDRQFLIDLNNKVAMNTDSLPIEKKNFINYHQSLLKLKKDVIHAYEQALRKNNDFATEYLDHFNATLEIKLPLLCNPAISLAEKKSLLLQLITSAKPNPDLMESLEPVVTPLFAFLGGVVGFLIGIPLGAMGGLIIAFYAIAKMNFAIVANTSGETFLFMLGALAAAGAVGGAIYGAYEFGKGIADACHSQFFKPSDIQDLTRKILNSPSLNNYLGREVIANHLNQLQHLLPELTRIVSAYVDPSELNQDELIHARSIV